MGRASEEQREEDGPDDVVLAGLGPETLEGLVDVHSAVFEVVFTVLRVVGFVTGVGGWGAIRVDDNGIEWTS